MFITIQCDLLVKQTCTTPKSRSTWVHLEVLQVYIRHRCCLIMCIWSGIITELTLLLILWGQSLDLQLSKDVHMKAAGLTKTAVLVTGWRLLKTTTGLQRFTGKGSYSSFLRLQAPFVWSYNSDNHFITLSMHCWVSCGQKNSISCRQMTVWYSFAPKCMLPLLSIFIMSVYSGASLIRVVFELRPTSSLTGGPSYSAERGHSHDRDCKGRLLLGMVWARYAACGTGLAGLAVVGALQALGGVYRGLAGLVACWVVCRPCWLCEALLAW